MPIAKKQRLDLPLPAEDETAFSLLARACRLSGYRSSLAGQAILGDARAGLIFDFPRGLSELSRQIRGAHEDPRRLAMDLTVAPYYTKFRKAEVAEKVLGQICGSSVAILKDNLGLRASANGPKFPVRACPECMAEDRDTHGVAYWHRSLQLPGVVVCQSHGTPLLESSAIAQGKQRSFFLPDELSWDRRQGLSQGRNAYQHAVRIAALSQSALLTSLPGGFQPETLHFTYRHALRTKGLVSRRGRLRAENLRHALTGHIATLPEAIRLCRPELSREVESLICIIRTQTQTFNTLPHLVLIDLLFETWDHFASIYQWESALLHHNSLSTGTGDASVNTYAHRHLGARLEKHEFKRNACRALLIDCVFRNASASRSQRAKVCGAVWRWLYRNDQEWLNANTPAALPRGRRYSTWVDWPNRDAKLIELIDRSDRVASFPTSARVTPNTVLRSVGPLPFSVQLHRMPKARVRLSELADQIRLLRK